MKDKALNDLRLDYYEHLVKECILRYQEELAQEELAQEELAQEELAQEELAQEEHPYCNKNHSWVRDNVYCILCVWGLTLAFRKMSDSEEGKSKAYQLEKAVVKTMRGLLRSMQMQTEKLEQFKRSQNPLDALHAKYSSISGKPVVGDKEWGHLQIDATSIFLLTLSQMISTGIDIIFTLDEVVFIQNMVFYIETAYRTPDYGIWERGDKTNHGLPELNASSIGLAKAALEAINQLDLFGSRGGPASVIHVLPDEAYQCQAILYSMLPRESISKETDAALLTVIGFPAFAVDDPEIIAKTRKTVMEKLEGSYGYKRFLRDGYKTAREDPHRLHYEPWELMAFENIECQWPLFFAFLILDGLFNNRADEVAKYQKMLEDIMLVSEEGIPVVPELYTVPIELVEKEYDRPNSQKRVATGRIPHMWSQSVYILGQLMAEGLISPGELDPLNRRHVTDTKPDIVVQVVVLCEDVHLKNKMLTHGVDLQTVQEVAPIYILHSSVLSKIYSLLGKNKRLGLSGRSSNEIGLLATSRLYMLAGRMLAFIPQVVDAKQFYLGMDVEYLIDDFTTKIDMLRCSWKGIGRPLLIYNLTRKALDNYQSPPKSLMVTIKKLQSGFIGGTRVIFGRLADFQHTSCVTQLSFLKNVDDQSGKYEKAVIDKVISMPPARSSRLSFESHITSRRVTNAFINLGITGIIRRSRSININPDEQPDLLSPLAQRRRNSIKSFAETSVLSLPSKVDLSAFADSSQSVENYGNVFHHLQDEEDISSENNRQTPRHSQQGAIKNLPEDTTDEVQLVEQLKGSRNLMEQADIIHYLFIHKGPYWDTGLEEGNLVPVIDLLKELYDKANSCKQWWLVRHTAGLLKKRIGDLALAVTDLLVRQKQLSVGLPPDNEVIIESPQRPDDLASLIFKACGSDYSVASLTQELLVYLAIYIRTEPRLFEDMLRIRVGLIIQVMVAELSRSLDCSGEEATDSLMNLSPFEMKMLLYHMLSGEEFSVEDDMFPETLGEAILVMRLRKPTLKGITDMAMGGSLHEYRSEDEIVEEIAERQGQWLRRRRLDGSLNRVPVGFYPQVWELLRRCRSLIIKDVKLFGSLTHEMTKQEFKFALQVEVALNSIPQPEYRQLLVEAMLVLSLLVEHDGGRLDLTDMDFEVDKIISEANRIFIRDVGMPGDIVEKTKGAANICIYLYDTAPGGLHGSMTYIVRAVAKTLNLPATSSNANCLIL
ncbi:unnamed protein product [Candidula unifasciata]|uniref:Phosphorylase b kinase regulatory subunit n=1 Tax=Candidula unifasciata TaxID=100452 RepID=A0A8S3YP19_9EUPU|nr:unnamed protein product [Candidula unifasciata]